MSVSGKRPDGRQARWAEHNLARRRVILDAAIAVVEAGAPGAEFHVHEIAQRAGLSRSVVYRHFEDRADLDRAIQAAIIEDLMGRLLPSLTLDGSIDQIITRIVSTYVDWAAAHPALHRLAERDAGGSGPLEQGIDRIATVVAEVLRSAIELLGADLDDDEQAALDPLAHGLVGAVFGAVRRWTAREPRRPGAAQLSRLLGDSVWHLLDGHARRLGLTVDPHVPIEQLLRVPDPEVAPG